MNTVPAITRCGHTCAALVALCLALLAACDEPATQYVRVEATGLEPGRGFTTVETPLVVEVRFHDAAGNLVEPGWFQWLGVANPLLPPDGKTTVTLEESVGVRRATVIPHRVGRIALEAIARPCPSCTEQRFGPTEYWVSAPADQVIPLNASPSSLVVGERRPFAAVALTTPEVSAAVDGRAIRSLEPVSITVADPSVASVDASGVVTALAEGETVVRFATAGESAEVVLQVVPGAIGPPTSGLFPIGIARLVQPKTGNTLVVDDRGWPTLVILPYLLSKVDHRPVVVAAWTGSGFGVELASQPLDDVSAASMVLDGRGRLYLVYRSGYPYLRYPTAGLNHLVVAERPGDGGPADWTYRELPREPDLSVPEVAPWDNGNALTEPRLLLSLLPRAGQGVWVGYQTVGPNPASTDAGTGCLKTLRLVEVSDATVAAADAERLAVSLEWCEARVGEDPECLDLFVTPPATVGAAARLAVLRRGPGGVYNHVIEYTRTGEVWSATRVVPPPDPEYDNLSIYGPARVATVEPMPPVGDATWVSTTSTEIPLIYGLAGSGSTWTAAGVIDPLIHEMPYGQVAVDSPAAYLVDPDDPDGFDAFRLWTVTGAAGGSRGLHWVVQNGLIEAPMFAAVVPPRPALHTDAETDGQRLTADVLTPIAIDAPVALPGGARMITLRHYGLRPWGSVDPIFATPIDHVVMRSAGPGEPWLAVPPDPARPRISGAWFEQGGATLGLDRPPGSPTIDVIRLGADGVTWEAVAAFTANGDLMAAVPSGSALFALWAPGCCTTSLSYSPDPLAGEPFIDLLAGVPTAPAVLTEREYALLEGDGEVVLLSSEGSSVRLHAFAADGSLIETHAAALPLQLYPRIRSSGLAPDGTVLLFVHDGSGHFTLLRSRDRMATLEVAATWTEVWTMPTAVVALSDGRLAFAVGRELAPDRWQAGVFTSIDGVAWDGPVAVRPDGGQGQRAAGIAALPGGEALVVIHDNGSMRGYEWTVAVAPEDIPPEPDAVMVRVRP